MRGMNESKPSSSAAVVVVVVLLLLAVPCLGGVAVLGGLWLFWGSAGHAAPVMVPAPPVQDAPVVQPEPPPVTPPAPPGSAPTP